MVWCSGRYGRRVTITKRFPRTKSVRPAVVPLASGRRFKPPCGVESRCKAGVAPAALGGAKKVNVVSPSRSFPPGNGQVVDLATRPTSRSKITMQKLHGKTFFFDCHGIGR